MNIQQSQTSVGRRVLWSALGVLALALIVCSIAYSTSGTLFGWKPFDSSTKSGSGDSTTSTQQINSGKQIKEKAIQDGKMSGSDRPTSPVAQNDGRLLVQVDITNVNKIENITRFGVLISTLDQSGTCTLTVTSKSGDAVYSASAGVQAMSNSSTCQGFDIPNSSLPSSGYTVTISYVSDNKYGVAYYEKP